MLDDLATVDWAALTHARGPADDVPELLRALADGDEDAHRRLHETFAADGDQDAAAVSAVPFLIRILDAPAAVPTQVMWLLTAIARGGRSASREAVAAGLPVYLRLLAAHPDEGVRASAAHLTGGLGPGVAGGASAALRQASVGDRAELVRVAAVRGLADRGETSEDRLADPSPLVRLVAATVVAEADPHAPLSGPVVQILERDSVASIALIERLPDAAGNPLGWVLNRLQSRPELQQRLVASWLRHPEAGASAALIQGPH
ncbi:hypothetical protein [Actinoplanes sp. NPDC020271]|uniref:hypothetical protein n=1 Tax=Actinoplanes sp. NPDC020271 TaxID=3363896 RepID=UPI0037880E90